MAYKCQILEATNTLWTSVFCIDTCVFTFSEVIGINKENNMSTNQAIYKWPLMIKNKYGYERHSTYAYYC